ncbi:MAG: hypothetical protein ACXU86_19860 [Archangium sp.]
MDFDFEKVLECLGRVTQGFPPSSEESACIELAARALHFLYTRDELDEFREHLQVADRPATEVIRIEHEFAGTDEAQRWLHSLAQPRMGVLVKIAGVTHVVACQNKDKWMFVRTLSPQELEEQDD